MTTFNDKYFPSMKTQRERTLSYREPDANGIGVDWVVCPGCGGNVRELTDELICLRCRDTTTYEAPWGTEVPEDKLIRFNDPELLPHQFKS